MISEAGARLGHVLLDAIVAADLGEDAFHLALGNIDPDEAFRITTAHRGSEIDVGVDIAPAMECLTVVIAYVVDVLRQHQYENTTVDVIADLRTHLDQQRQPSFAAARRVRGRDPGGCSELTKYWQARVEWATGETDDEGALDVLMRHLAGHGAVAGPKSLPPTDPTGRQHWAAVVTVEGNTLREAVAAALELVEGATREKATAIEVLPDDVADARTLAPVVPELVGHTETAEILGVSRQRAAQLAARPDFPPPVVTTKTGPLRTRAAVDAWAKGWTRKSGRPRGDV